MIKKIIFFLILAILIAIFSAFIVKKLNKLPPDNNKVQVVTTLYPLYDFSKNIAGDRADVSLLLPPGVEPHSFEPKPDDVFAINNADIFIYTGKFMEVWAQDIINGLTNNNVLVVDSSKNIKLIPSVFVDEDGPAGSMDPHIWLDFDKAKTMVDNITDAFVQADPQNSSYYKHNAAEYKQRLDDLDKQYSTALASCKSKDIIYAGHYAFGYLAKRYSLNYVAALGVSPDAEPTVSDLISLVEQIKKGNIKYIFYEELTSPKIAQTLSGETGTSMLILNALHNVSKKDIQNGVSYIYLMDKNLDNLKKGLQCQ